LTYWQVPPLWRGQTAAILAGGPSLTPEQVEACRGRCRVIAVNNSYLAAPWADVLYFSDAQAPTAPREMWHWWNHHRERPEYRAFGGLKVTLENPFVIAAEPETKSLYNVGESGFPERRDALTTGKNSGYQAIVLAALLGARRIALLGYDMRCTGGKTHWHGGHAHRTHSGPNIYRDFMLPHFAGLAKALAARGVEVLNATPDSALTDFPMTSLKEALT
jgi:hypothetical protein